MDSGANSEDKFVQAFRWRVRYSQEVAGGGQKEMVKLKGAAFKLIPKESVLIFGGILTEINQNGGDVIWPGDHELRDYARDYGIRLLNEKYFFDNPKENMYLPLDTFSGMFVFDAVKAFKMGLPPPDLNKYRLTPSKYHECDANQVLYQKLKWTELARRENENMSRITAQFVLTKFKESMKKRQEGEGDAEPEVGRSSEEPGVRGGNVEPCDEIENFEAPEKEVVLQESPEIGIANEDAPNVQDGGGASPKNGKNQNQEDQVLEEAAVVPEPPPKSPEVVAGPSHVSHQKDGDATGKKNSGVDSDKSDGTRPQRMLLASEVGQRFKALSKKQDQRRLVTPPRPPPKTVGKTGSSSSSEVGHVRRRRHSRVILSSSSEDESDIEMEPENPESVDVPEDKSGSEMMDVDYNSNEEDDDDGISVGDSASTFRSAEKRRRRKSIPFPLSEGQRILNLICKHRAYRFISGNKLWKLMEKSKKFPNRTYQSLRNHFLKSVLPQVRRQTKLYVIKPDHLKELRQARKQVQETKHGNMCPNFKF